jgi:hypothetical protein
MGNHSMGALLPTDLSNLQTHYALRITHSVVALALAWAVVAAAHKNIHT